MDLSQFREKYPVTITKLPALEHLSWEEIHQFTNEMTLELEAKYDRERTARPLGRAAMLAQHPHNAPKRSKKGRAPIVHCRDRRLESLFKSLAKYLTGALRSANRAIREGTKDVVFPPFCHPARLPYVPWDDSLLATATATQAQSTQGMSSRLQATMVAPQLLYEILTELVPLLPA